MILPRVIDVFGQAGFDVISITDHIVNGDNSIGRATQLLKLSITQDSFGEYLNRVKEEGQRAWDKYEMLVIPGVEISKNYVSAEKSAHILLLDIKQFVSASWSYERIFLEAKKQDAVVIACHPHHSTKVTSKETLFLWNNRGKYRKYIDAWEIANRDDVFNVISLKKLPYIANSDFHKIRHLYSWKTLLNCRKDLQSVKDCLKQNRNIAITLFRN